MPDAASKALAMLLVIALIAGASRVMSRLELFGMERPEAARVTDCAGEVVELDGVRAELLALHNEERAERGVPPLCWSEDPAAAATAHSEDMMERGFFAHETPEGITPADRTLSSGYDSSFIAENIQIHHMSVGFEPNMKDLEEVVRGWMESPGHRRNLLDPELHEVGIGASFGKYRRELDSSRAYTVDFGTPQTVSE